MRTFQCMGKIFCMEFQREPLKFHTKLSYPYIERDDFYTKLKILRALGFKELISVFEMPPWTCSSLWLQMIQHLTMPGYHEAVCWLGDIFFKVSLAVMISKQLPVTRHCHWQGSHRVWKTWKNKIYWKIHWKVMELRNIRNLALISFASHRVSCIHSNTSDYELLGEFEASPLVYCDWFLI